jgi:hypothetical protein
MIDTHYICGTDGPRVLLLAGPFADAAQARSWVEPTEHALLDRGQLEVALGLRVSRLVGSAPARPGDLNDQLGV